MRAAAAHAQRRRRLRCRSGCSALGLHSKLAARESLPPVKSPGDGGAGADPAQSNSRVEMTVLEIGTKGQAGAFSVCGVFVCLWRGGCRSCLSVTVVPRTVALQRGKTDCCPIRPARDCCSKIYFFPVASSSGRWRKRKLQDAVISPPPRGLQNSQWTAAACTETFES